MVIMESDSSSPPHGGNGVDSSSSLSFPFFNHNATTVPNNLPPSIDDKPMARQKRKRTSPEDQAVLEAYYARDPKPDKAARLDLVKRVALGEKEVQIWFQNRRQSSRRKSRPLLPHEIAQYQLAKSMASTEASSEASHSDSRQESDLSDVAPCSECNGSRAILSDLPTAEPAKVEQHSCSQRPGLIQELATSTLDSASRHLSRPSENRPSFGNPGSTTLSLLLDADQSESHYHSGPVPSEVVLEHAQLYRRDSPPRARKASSLLRLSLNSEGRAEVVSKDASSPSPPRAHAVSRPVCVGQETRPLCLQPECDESTAQVASSTLHRAPSGRSKDSRSWEFWCDKDCRSELEEKAEKDASGSAADAIQLLRSASGRNILGAVSSKRNSTAPGRPNGPKRMRRGGRLPLQRSSTSNGRLQGKAISTSQSTIKDAPKLKSAKSMFSGPIPSNDSDKENWSPDSDVQFEAHGGLARASSAHDVSLDKLGRRPTTTFERRPSRSVSIDPENDPEIAAFMRAGRESDKVSNHEELDCVQGLLSLSQGNWR